MYRVTDAYRLRLQAIEDYAIGLMNPKKYFNEKIWARYEEYMESDIILARQRGQDSKEAEIRKRYNQERASISKINSNKKVGFAVNEVGKRLPDRARDPNLARFVTILRTTNEEISRNYPPFDGNLLRVRGYIFDRFSVPFFPVP